MTRINLTSPNKVKSRIHTRTSSEKFATRASRLVLYMGCLITYSEYLAEIASK